MRNINKRSLLTASSGMKHSHRLSLLGMGRIFLCALLLFGFQAAFAQIHLGIPNLPAITGSTTICIGTSTTLNDGAPDGTWSSSNPAVASVGSTTGMVTGNAGGVATITYTVGISTITTVVTVTYPISGTATLCTGNTLNLTDSTYSGSWTSSNTSVVTVSPVLTAPVATGELMGMSAGTATITYGRYGYCAVTQVVTVAQNNVGAISSAGALGVCVGGTVTATDTTAGGIWTSNNVTMATINAATGVINGVAAGAVTITYTGLSGCWTTKPLTVTSPSSLAAITGTATLCVGNTTTLLDATSLGAWSGSNPAVATVYPGGIVNGVSAGTLVVTYAKGGCAVFHPMTINANTVAPITGVTSICLGATTQLNDATPSGTWTSGNTTIATIGTTGLVTGTGVGTSLISYSLITYTVGGCYVTTSVVVNPSTSVGAISGNSNICKGATSALSDAVPGGAWFSGNTAVGTITNYGMVTGVGAGTTTITYTRLGCSMYETFTVNPTPGAITGSNRECANRGTTVLSNTTLGGVWSSSNLAYSTVAGTTAGAVSDGVVTGVAPGMDTIYYTLGTGCFASITDTAYGPAPIGGGNFVCIEPMTYLNLHDATSTGYGGTIGTWSTSNSAVASVSSGGAVTGVSAGTCNITYTITRAGLSCYVTNSVTAGNAPGPIAGGFTTCIGATTALTDTASGVIWSSGNTSVATVGSLTGIVSGVSGGGALITVSKNGCNRTASITVDVPPAAITGLSSVCASYAQIVDTDYTPGGTWSATNSTGLLEITQTGSTYARVTGVTAGSCSITYTLGGCIVSKGITVVSDGAGSISSVNTICNGLTETVASSGVGGMWTSGNIGVASFSGAVTSTSVTVVGVSVGTTVLTYTITSTGCFKVLSPFYVKQQPGTIYGPVSLCNGTTITLFDSTIGGQWTSSNTHLLSVTNDTTNQTSLGVDSAKVAGLTSGIASVTYTLPGGCESVLPIHVNLMPYTLSGASAVCNSGPSPVTQLTDVMTGGTWSSLNLGVGTVDNLGNVTGISAGSTIITYSMGNNCYVTKALTVGSVTPTLNGPVRTCAMGTADTALTGTPSGGTWATNNSFIASISSGKVTGVSAGTVMITYTVNGCYTTQYETVFADTISSITGSLALCAGSSLTYTEPSILSGGGVWSSSNTAVGTIGSVSGAVSSALFTAIAPGSSVLTFTNSAAGGCNQWMTVNVGNVTPNAIGYTTANMCAGAYTTYTDPTSGGNWITSNSSVAAINSYGQLYGASAGTASITYGFTSGTMAGCYPAVVTVTINPMPAAITGNLTVCKGNVTTLSETLAGGAWISSNLAVGTVDGSGDVGGAAAGNVTISYAMPTGCQVTAAVAVGSPTVAITGAATICGGVYTTFTASQSGGTWTSYNSSIATVTSGGSVYGVGNGVDTIYYATPGCPAFGKAVTVNYVAPISGTAYAICLSDSIVLTDATLGGVWSTNNSAIARIGSAGVLGDSIQVNSVSGGYDTINYTVGACPAVSQSIWVDGACTGRESGGATGVGTVNTNDQVYSLYPNPSNGNIVITQSVAMDGMAMVSVLNFTGEKVYAGSIFFTNGKGQVNLSVASGIYLVGIQDNNGGFQTLKAVIEK